MLRRRSVPLLAAIAAVAALALASCGDDGAEPRPAARASAASVGVSPTSLGATPVDSDGHALYGFGPHDGHGGCDGDCSDHWRPVVADGDTAARDGVDAALLGRTMWSDGTPQLSYAGHALYRYDGDHDHGDHRGHCHDEHGGEWHALDGDGNDHHHDDCDDYHQGD